MVTPCLEEQEILAEKLQAYPVLYEKIKKVLKEKIPSEILGRKWWKI